MVKKKRDRVDVEELIARPWCYYCERDFDDQKVLISHQKAKHFKCDNCNRRLNTAGGLSVHLQQVHKETLEAVDNAIEGRQGVEPEVFGMMGIPEELVNAHRQRILNEYYKQEAERRAQTGNPPPGQKNGEPNAKKRKMETPEELKARLAEHRAKRQAEKQAEKEGKAVQQSASNTPDIALGQGQAAMDAQHVSSSTFTYPGATINAFEQEFSPNPQPSYDPMQAYGPQFHPPHPGLPMQSPLSGGIPSPFPVQQPGHWPPHMSPASFSPPQVAPFATPPFMPPVHSPMTGQMPGGMMPSHNMRYSPSATVDRQAVPPPQTPLQHAPGLPARPSFDLPNFNREDMQRMHTGQVPPPNNNTAHQQHNAIPPKPTYNKLSTIEDVEAMLQDTKNEWKQQQADEAAAKASAEKAAQEAAKTSIPATSSKEKKKKSKPAFTKMIYSDNNESPEEKMAKQSKYAYAFRPKNPEFVEGEVGGAVTGVTVDQDTVLDVQD